MDLIVSNKYLYILKNSITDTLGDKIPESNRDELTKIIEDALVWLEDNPAAEKSACDEKQKGVESLANPILKRAYESINLGGIGAHGIGGDDDYIWEPMWTVLGIMRWTSQVWRNFDWEKA